MSRTKRGVGRARLFVALYGIALRLYPVSFREQFARDMLDFQRDRARELRGRPLAAATAWMWAIAECGAQGLRERLASRRLSRNSGRAGGPGSQSDSVGGPQSGSPSGPMSWYERWCRLLQDLKLALRRVRQRPAPSLAIVLVLALGIGANAVLFAVVDAVVLRGLPFPQPEELMMVWNRYGEGTSHNSPPDFIDRRDRSHTFDSLAAFRQVPRALSGDGPPEQITVARVTSRFFQVMGVGPLLGTAEIAHEQAAEPDDRVVLSAGLWQRRFGGRSDVLGSTVRLDGESFVIAGVMPSGFDFPRDTDLWTALQFSPQQTSADNHGNEYLLMVGRLEAEATVSSARSELETLAADFVARTPERQAFLTKTRWSSEVVSLSDEMLGGARPALWLLFAAVGALLLLVCANVANLLLALASSRQREIATRRAMGASRRRLVQQLLIESQVLASLGLLGGLGTTLLGLRFLPHWLPHDLPHLERLGIDVRVLLFALAVTALCGLLIGLLPAWRLSSDAGSALVAPRAAAAGRRSRRLLAIGEVATAAVLLVVTGLLLQSFRRTVRVDTGFESEARLTFSMALPRGEYSSPEPIRQLQDQLTASLAALPGIRSAAISDRLPLDGQRWTGTVRPVTAESGVEEAPGPSLHVVGPGFFETLGIPLLEGRGFASTDHRDGQRVVVINERMAQVYWPDGALGQQINLAAPGDPEILREIVGVVGSIREDSLVEEGQLQAYFSATQVPPQTFSVTLRLDQEAVETLGPVRRVVADLAPDVPIYSLRPLQRVIGASVALERFNVALLAAFAAVALLLAGGGLYVVLSFSVSQRTSELGVRMALGAPAERIVRQVMGEGLGLIAIGLAVGAAGAWAATRALRGMLFEISPGDPMTFLAVALVLAAVGLLAVLLPALRAARLDPVVALRTE